MVKGFRLRFSRVIPSFQFCRSKQPSTFPQSPIPAIYRISPVNSKALDISYPNFPNPPPSTPQDPTPVHPSIKRHVSLQTVSVGCGCRSKSCARYLSSDYSIESPDYTWTRDGKWHVVGKVERDDDDDDNKPRRKIYSPSDSGDTDDDLSMTPLLNTKKQCKKQRSKKKKNVKTSVRTSTSSGDSGWFTSEENEEETETLVSSRSFTNDSSNDFDDQLDSKSKKPSNRQTKNNAKKFRKLKRHSSKDLRGSSATGKTNTKLRTPSPESESPVRTPIFQRMMPCKVDGKVAESFAVVKKSEDPYEDFKWSMLDMIMEKQMFEAKDLEELLHCFLSLNSRHHHGVIVEAFSEIWDVLFSKFPMNQRANSLKC